MDLLAAYERGLIAKKELFLRLVLAMEHEAPSTVIAALPADLRAEFEPWARDFSTGEGLIIGGKEQDRVPEAAMRALRAWAEA